MGLKLRWEVVGTVTLTAAPLGSGPVTGCLAEGEA